MDKRNNFLIQEAWASLNTGPIISSTAYQKYPEIFHEKFLSPVSLKLDHASLYELSSSRLKEPS